MKAKIYIGIGAALFLLIVVVGVIVGRNTQIPSLGGTTKVSANTSPLSVTDAIKPSSLNVTDANKGDLGVGGAAGNLQGVGRQVASASDAVPSGQPAHNSAQSSQPGPSLPQQKTYSPLSKVERLTNSLPTAPVTAPIIGSCPKLLSLAQCALSNLSL